MRFGLPIPVALRAGAVPAVLLALAACDDPVPPAGEPAWLPPLVSAAAAPAGGCDDFNPLGNVYFGDAHVHTAFSLDAYAFGNTFLEPADAIRFAGGAEIPHVLGGTVRLDRPLDFVVVTDHAEFFDLLGMCIDDPDNPAYTSDECVALRADSDRAITIITQLTFNLPPAVPLHPAAAERARRRMWRKSINQANAGYQPCTLTTLVGYEWTGGTTSGQQERGNLHRNIVFYGSTLPATVADAIRSPHERQLWAFLRDECLSAPDCDAISIPHNSNLAKQGAMWDLESDADAALRAEIETLVEIYQHKGDSECSNFGLDPADAGYDALCNFEKITFASIPDAGLGQDFGEDEADDRRSNMVRHALGKGVAEWEVRGFNPLMLGILAATDNHNATAGLVDEAEFRGGHGRLYEGSPEIRLSANWERSGGGLAAVWAPQNTREAIFAALKHREVYGTSGPRIRLRFYAAAVSADACNDTAFPAAIAAAPGAVPMGAVVPATAAAQVGGPWFVARAVADAVPLERLQVIRLRAGAGGGGAGSDYSEFVTDVAVAADPKAGAQILCAAWRDPDYAPGRAAAYYVRAVELPTRRWSAYSCEEVGAYCRGEADIVRERAWSSPIWVAP